MISIVPEKTVRLVTYLIEGRRYGLRLSVVSRILHAVEITPLFQAPEVIAGIINVQGRIVPVVNMRRLLSLPERELIPRDKFILALTSKRIVALIVDEASGTAEYPENEVEAAVKALPERYAAEQYAEGIVKLDDGILLVHDLERFLSIEDEETLSKVIPEPGERL